MCAGDGPDNECMITRIVFRVQRAFESCKAAIDEWDAVGVFFPVEVGEGGAVFGEPVAQCLLVGVKDVNCEMRNAREVVETLG